MSSDTRGSADGSEDSCYFCAGGAGVIEQHHIVPRRHGGSDKGENLVGLCPTCHERLERLYNKRFYNEIGVAEKKTQDEIIVEKAVEISQLLWRARIRRKKEGHDIIEDAYNRFFDQYRLNAKLCKACGMVTRTNRNSCEHCGSVMDQ